MGRLINAFFIIAFLHFFSPITSTLADKKSEDERVLTLISGINRFSTQFYKHVAEENQNKSLVMSPLSINILLALLSLGSHEETQKELHSALYLQDQYFIKSTYGPAVKSLHEIPGITLKLANKIFVKYALAPEFKQLAADIFSSEAQHVDFRDNKRTAHIINSWVEEKTNNKIGDLIPAETLDIETVIVLINAIYFKGSWDRKFNPDHTKKADFHLNNNEKIQVDMMHQINVFRYANLPEWNAKVVELPYEKDKISMVIILPDRIQGMKSIEDKLASDGNLAEILRKIRKSMVRLSLPKFKIETTLQLNKVLSDLGMSRIFSRNADLSGLLQNKQPLVISSALQKSMIEVNEFGAEAASASALMAVPRSFGVKMEIFEANHPFIYIIISDKGLILFMGKHIK